MDASCTVACVTVSVVRCSVEEQMARTASANERRKEKKTAAQLFGLQKTEFNVLPKLMNRVATPQKTGSGYSSRV